MKPIKTIFTVLSGAVFLFPSVQAMGAGYIGDTVIYSAIAVGGDTTRPNVLFIVDNSKATLNVAAGVPYDPDYLYASVGGVEPWTIYSGDNQGDFNSVELTNPSSTLEDPALENLTSDSCADVIRSRLLTRGMYTGNGSESAPNISHGECDTSPKGAVYALGNYLNYLNQIQVSGDDRIVEVTYTKSPSNQTVTDKYLLTQSHIADETNKPGEGSDWGPYWTVLKNNDSRSATDPWTEGTNFQIPATFHGKSQREIVYDALEQVVGAARDVVNFGAMTYGEQGGKIVYDMADLSTDSPFDAFLTAIPGPGASDGEGLLHSETGRPQGEALYDAGHYFEASYPGTQQSITETKTIPEDVKNPCGYDHVILITNGLSNGDSGSASSFGALGDYDGDKYPDSTSPDESVYGNGSHYLDDIARYLKINSNITTHTILAFQSDDDLVRKAALEGEGLYFNVYDANELADALTKLLANIVLETDSAFVAPVVPTNPENRTFSGHRVYLGFFYPRSQKAWHGNLKKFGINSQNEIIDKNEEKATCPDSSDNHCSSNDIPDGNFRSDAVSYWGNSTDGGIVEAGGVGQVMQNMTADRKIFTYPPGSASKELTHDDNQFIISNAKITSSILAVDDTEKDDLIQFVHGYDAYAPNVDLDNDGVMENQEKRSWIIGDILHSKPLVVNYNNFSYENESTCTGTDANKSIIFVGANDGMLHAFRDCDGAEAWAFIPPGLLPRLNDLPNGEHSIFVDSSPIAYKYDKDGDGVIESSDGDWVMLIFGLRRGGSAYYALDVTDPENPEYLWTITSDTSGFEELAQSWSEPQFGLVKDGSAKKVVAFIGAGYDNLNEDQRFGNTQAFTGDESAEPTNAVGDTTSSGTSTGVARGRGVYAFLVATFDANGNLVMATSPTKVWGFTRTGTISSHTHASFNQGYLDFSFPGDVAPVDTDFDGFIDRLYIGDTGGRMWRISDHHTSGELLPKPNADISTWFGRIVFSSNPGSDNSNGRKIFYRPSVVIDNGYVGVYFGTGDRAHPLNTTVQERLYAIFDRGQRTNESITESNLEDVTADSLQDGGGTNAETCTASSSNLNCILERLSSNDNYGWYIRMDTNYGALEGEKVLAPALVFNKVAYYTTYTPNPSTGEIETSDDCAGNLGTSRMWAIDYHTGEAVFNFNTVNDDATVTNERATNQAGDIVLNYQDRFKGLGVGIPSGLVMVINAEGDAQVLIGCGGGVCPGASLPGGTVFPVYWMPW